MQTSKIDSINNALKSTKGRVFGLRYKTASGEAKSMNAKVLKLTPKSVVVVDNSQGSNRTIQLRNMTSGQISTGGYSFSW